MKKIRLFTALAGVIAAAALILTGCAQPAANAPAASAQQAGDGLHRFAVLDPGHFHAGLVLKPAGYKGVSPEVGIYAPVGEDYVGYMNLIVPFNTRAEDPAHWIYRSYLGPDYEAEMFAGSGADIAVLSGKNQPKVDRILACVRHGMNVLADKPWVIEPGKLAVLDTLLREADRKGLVAYDIMTERFEVTSNLQRRLIQDKSVFGEIIQGTPEDPAVVKKSVHHLFKTVAGRPLVRPWWFFDTAVQGEGLVDVTTHLVDITFWCLFPEQAIDYKTEIKMVSAEHWPTVLTPAQFGTVTGKPQFPAQFSLDSQGNLPYYCNGRMNFAVRGVNALLQVEWNFQAPAGGGDTHYSVIRGSQANVMIMQGAEQNYRPELYVEAASGADRAALGAALQQSIASLAQTEYPGLELKEEGSRWHILVPDKYRVGHESHFGQVTGRFLGYLDGEKMPAWENANMLAKYYVTTSALEMARKK